MWGSPNPWRGLLPAARSSFTWRVVAIAPGREESLQRINVEGTRNVVDACLRTGTRRLVYTSPVHALTELGPGGVLEESAGFDPAKAYGDYGKSKAAGSLAAPDGARRDGRGPGMPRGSHRPL